jgi:hypothetical protein
MKTKIKFSFKKKKIFVFILMTISSFIVIYFLVQNDIKNIKYRDILLDKEVEGDYYVEFTLPPLNTSDIYIFAEEDSPEVLLFSLQCMELGINTTSELNKEEDSDALSGVSFYSYEGGTYHLYNPENTSVSYSVGIISLRSGTYQIFIIHDFIDLSVLCLIFAFFSLGLLTVSIVSYSSSERSNYFGYTFLIYFLLWMGYTMFGMAVYLPWA